MIVGVLLALTYPGGGEGALFRGSASVQGLCNKGDRLAVLLLPLTMVFVFSATNVFVVAPKTISLQWKLQVGTLTRGFGPRCMRIGKVMLHMIRIRS